MPQCSMLVVCVCVWGGGGGGGGGEGGVCLLLLRTCPLRKLLDLTFPPFAQSHLSLPLWGSPTEEMTEEKKGPHLVWPPRSKEKPQQKEDKEKGQREENKDIVVRAEAHSENRRLWWRSVWEQNPNLTSHLSHYIISMMHACIKYLG